MKKQILKNKKGITLIALVVTIVLLLILAGVTIAMLGGENGIITQATKAKEKTKDANAKEKIAVEVQGSYGIDGNLSIDLLNKNLGNIDGIIGWPISKLPATVELDGVKVVINENGSISEPIQCKKYETETDIKIGNVPVTVPGGATISGISGEYENVENGVVVYIIPDGEQEIIDWEADSDDNGIIDVQEKYDQFVWVPVPNAIAVDMNNDKFVDTTDIDLMIAEERYPIAIATGTTTDDEGNTITNYRGVLYNFTLTDGNVVIADKSYNATAGIREPAYLTDEAEGDASDNNNVKITESSLQNIFNTMVEKVADNKGFWVGRYETSNMVSDNIQDSTQQVSIKKGTTIGISNVNWYRMYAQQKNYSNLVKISSTSSMIWGCQWDQIMIWMKEVDNEAQSSKYVVNSIGMGNYGLNADGITKTKEETGNSENYKVKNVYDLAGNVCDWTLEAYGTTLRVLRRRRQWKYIQY